MRSGGCTVLQALTQEAAAFIKQAIRLAKQRGHAQVTPLHVAHTMLSPSAAAATCVLRTACLQSNSHPLQCKALELCFSVALNRLPAFSSSTTIPDPMSIFPPISNALVAAFKRAQAHQRRGGSADQNQQQQQQAILTAKIELDQLIISILDDPSVSRVMKEAGFSSTQVKTNVEQLSSLKNTHPKESSSLSLSPPRVQTTTLDQIRNADDVGYVIDNLVNQRRYFVIVGECLATIESVVKGVMEKVEKREVPQELRDAKFITLNLSRVSWLEVEEKIEEMKRIVRSCVGEKVVLNLGDLSWVSEYYQQNRRSYTCPVEHITMELNKLGCGLTGENRRFWVIGISTFQNYLKFKAGNPSLEILWGLHPLTIPAGSLRLSLTTNYSDLQSKCTSSSTEMRSRRLLLEGGGDQEEELSCCADCLSQFESESRTLLASNSDSTNLNLPVWLRQYKNVNKGFEGDDNIDKDSLTIEELRRKWNGICKSVHKNSYSSGKTMLYFSSYSYEHQHSSFQHTDHDQTVTEPIYHQFLKAETPKPTIEPELRLFINSDPIHRYTSSNPDSTTNSASTSSEAMEIEYIPKFKELNTKTLETLIGALGKKVPWKKDIIPEIVSTVLKCRSGIVRRKGKERENEFRKEETWLLFQGGDIEGKEKLSRELAKLVFGSRNCFVSISLSSFSSTKSDSTDQECTRSKRSRDEQSCSYIKRFSDAILKNPHRVFFIEDFEQFDCFSQMGFKKAMERGRLMKCSSGDDVFLSDAIIILSCENMSSRSRGSSPKTKAKLLDDDEEEKIKCSLDLNISIGDHDSVDQDCLIDDSRFLEMVDSRFVFELQEL